MLFLILFLFIIFIKFGVLAFLQILIWISVFFISNFLLGFNPQNLEYKIIKIMSLIVIGVIIFVNSNTTEIMAFSFPFSFFNVTKLIDCEGYNHTRSVLIKGALYQWDKENVAKLLTKLEEGKIYTSTIEFVQDYSLYDDYDPYPKLLISDPIVIISKSDPEILSGYIYNQLNKVKNTFNIFDITSKNSVVLFLITEIDFKNK